MLQKRIAVVQSSYIPWKSYFDVIRAVDEFILLDDVQFTRRDWRSCNRIKTKDGPQWLSIPVQPKGRYRQRIEDIVVSDFAWGSRHWARIQAAYGHCPGFSVHGPAFEPLVCRLVSDHLSQINHSLIIAVCARLAITTPVTWSRAYAPGDWRNQRLIDLCTRAEASEYLSEPSTRAYLDFDAFAAAGIQVRFVDYTGYKEHEQPYPPFEDAVSVLDLLFCTGDDATEYLKPLCPETAHQ